jgi:DNA-binding transcriptional LysR family regulator
LLRERHVTRAAKRVGLSQPAASRGLGRLRDLLGDPLLVRSGAAFALTPRAEALLEPVRQALGIVQAAIAKPAGFDPAAERRTIRLVTDDYSGLVLLPKFLSRLTKAAPGIDVWAVPGGSSFGIEQLARGEIDFLITSMRPEERLPPLLRSEALYTERFVCVVRRGHPLVRKRATVERFARARHAFVAPRGGRGGAVDEALAQRGKERRIALATPHFLVMPFIIAQSDLVLTLGERVARTYAAFLPIAVFEPPLPLRGFTIGMFWHERVEHDPALGWFRAEMREAASEIEQGRAPGRAPSVRVRTRAHR